MIPLALTLLTGALCLPATYILTREGSILVVILILLFIGAMAGAATVTTRGPHSAPRVVLLLLAFVTGAAVSEVIDFAHYYATYGHQDPKLGAGIAISVIEFAVISVVGCVALLVSAYITQRHITRRSKRRAPDLALHGLPLSRNEPGR